MNKRVSIWIGYDPREAVSFAIARHSILKFKVPEYRADGAIDRYIFEGGDISIHGLILDDLRDQGLYQRPTERTVTGGRIQLRDTISNAPMASEFSISRFLVPHLAKTDWALYMDCDMFFRRDPRELFDLADDNKAVMVVKHDYKQEEGVKKDGQIQTVYGRKNWSSVMLFNVNHPSCKKLTVDFVNQKRGLELHQFCWCADEEIGALPVDWNYCVGHSKMNGAGPSLVHFTEGMPDLHGYEDQEYADEWRALKAAAVGAHL